MDSEIIEGTQIMRIPLTQSNGKSKVKYSWIVLFKIDVNEREPFFCEPVKTFEGSNFPLTSIQGEMKKECRIKSYEFNCFPGELFFIFAKVQKGKVHTYLFLKNYL